MSYVLDEQEAPGRLVVGLRGHGGLLAAFGRVAVMKLLETIGEELAGRVGPDVRVMPGEDALVVEGATAAALAMAAEVVEGRPCRIGGEMLFVRLALSVPDGGPEAALDAVADIGRYRDDVIAGSAVLLRLQGGEGYLGWRRLLPEVAGRPPTFLAEPGLVAGGARHLLADSAGVLARAGLAGRADLWVVAQALAVLAQWPEVAVIVPVSRNVLADAPVFCRLQALLEAARPGGRLTLMLQTEGAGELARELGVVRALGVGWGLAVPMETAPALVAPWRPDVVRLVAGRPVGGDAAALVGPWARLAGRKELRLIVPAALASAGLTTGWLSVTGPLLNAPAGAAGAGNGVFGQAVSGYDARDVVMPAAGDRASVPMLALYVLLSWLVVALVFGAARVAMA